MQLIPLPTGQFFFHITGAFAELERNLIRERTKTGLKAARARGKNGGRPKAIDQKTFDIAMQLYNDGNISVTAMCKRLGIVKRTFYRYLKDHKAEKVGQNKLTAVKHQKEDKKYWNR
jgi:DNA invertase Pin-like site-specific DNA recombinase